MNILITDDEKNIRESIQRFMELNEIQSDCAEDALKAKPPRPSDTQEEKSFR